MSGARFYDVTLHVKHRGKPERSVVVRAGGNTMRAASRYAAASYRRQHPHATVTGTGRATFVPKDKR